jgi:hypothetical protein
MFFKKVTKKVVDNAKEVVKDEVTKTVDKQLPIIVGIVAIAVTIFSIVDPVKSRVQSSSIHIVNNYYIYNGGSKL